MSLELIVQGDNKVFVDVSCFEEDGKTPRDLTGASLAAAMSVNGAAVFHPSVAILGSATAGVARVTVLETQIPADTTDNYGSFALQITATWASDGTVKSSSIVRGIVHRKLR